MNIPSPRRPNMQGGVLLDLSFQEEIRALCSRHGVKAMSITFLKREPDGDILKSMLFTRGQLDIVPQNVKDEFSQDALNRFAHWLREQGA